MNAYLEPGEKIMREGDRPGATLCVAIAQEMRVARGLLEQLAAVLVADERFSVDYLDQLQAFDLIVQYVDESAAVLDRFADGQELDAVIGGVRLSAVQQRLRAALKLGVSR